MNHHYRLISVFGERTLGLRGNTAAVVHLTTPLSEDRMQAIAADFCQPATTFVWPAYDEGAYHIRWYAPDAEIGLCGHGSLAAISSLKEVDGRVRLHYRNGVIEAVREGDEQAYIELAAIKSKKAYQPPAIVEEALGMSIAEYHTNDNKHILVVNNEEMVASAKPDFAKLREHDNFGWILTAPGRQVDFVSRTFVPHVQQLEDPATGSSHACLTPFWAARLKKDRMVSRQLSKRGAQFVCESIGDLVRLRGECQWWSEGMLKT